MAHTPEALPVAQHPHDGHFENVCLTGTVVMTAFFTGLAVTAIIFWWALFAHHGAG